MASKKLPELSEAVAQLRQALDLYRKARKEKGIHFLTVAKAFEVLVEMAWKELRRHVQDEGLDSASPKEAVRQASRLEIISDPEFWLGCIEARNDSVHNYFGLPKSDYVEMAEKFLAVVRRELLR
jgi:nucleotidyltransferase substrate binding protein (TIGR01987 family)